MCLNVDCLKNVESQHEDVTYRNCSDTLFVHALESAQLLFDSCLSVFL